MANAEVFDSFFRRADLDRDGRISGSEAVGFFQGSGLPQATLAKIWQFSDQSRAGFLSRHEFINALKLVTVAQTGRELTPELVKAALSGPAASQIPPPRINTPTPPPTSFWPASSSTDQYINAIPHWLFPVPSSSSDSFHSSAGKLRAASGFSAAGSGMAQARPSLGGLMGTSSLPSGAQGTRFSTGMGLPTGPGFQSSAAPGLPRPTAPSGMLASAASLPSAASTPGF